MFSKKQLGDAAEDRALQHLQRAGVRLLVRTLVFVEVRARADERFGGAAASVGASKQRRIVFAARHYLMRLPAPPPCRFDVVCIHGPEAAEPLAWLRGAFDAG